MNPRLTQHSQVSKFVLLAFLASIVGQCDGAVHWTYLESSLWDEHFAACSGKKQSPININTSAVVIDPWLANDTLKFGNYSGIMPGSFFNNGHTLQFSINDTVKANGRPRIYGGGLGPNGYILEQFHFHWGNSSQGQAACMGAEHTIDFRSAPAELHLVHFNSKYSSLAEALAVGKADALAVIGFLFEPVTDTTAVRNDFTQVADLIGKVPEVDDEVVTRIDFGRLIPNWAEEGIGRFFRYDGSLTAPPCLEVVTWTVFETRIPMLTKTLDSFRKAMEKRIDEKTHKEYEIELVNNFRPLQDLNGRIVKTNKEAVSDSKAAQGTSSHSNSNSNGSGSAASIPSSSSVGGGSSTQPKQQGAQQVVPTFTLIGLLVAFSLMT